MLYRYNDSDLILPSPQFPSLVMREDDYPVEYYVRRLLRNPMSCRTSTGQPN